MNILINLFLAIWMIVALLMILVILMQRPKSEGLGAAFGGAMTENIFGAQTTTVLTKITGWLAGIFFMLTFGLSVLYAHKATSESALSKELKKADATQTSSAPSPQTSPSASAAPDSGAGVLPAGSASPFASPTGSVKPSDAAVGAIPPVSATTTPAASPKSKRKPRP